MIKRSKPVMLPIPIKLMGILNLYDLTSLGKNVNENSNVPLEGIKIEQ